MSLNIHSKSNITQRAQYIWQKLGDIPTDDDGNIEEAFHSFSVGTNREQIWHWIERTFNISVHELMFPSEHNQKK